MSRIIPAVLMTIALTACGGNDESHNMSDTSHSTAASTDTMLTSPAGSAPTPTNSQVSPADQEFFTRAARTGMAEVQLATNVTQRAQSADVKAFAQRMITDHNASNQELMSLAARKQLDPPADLDPKHKALDEQLAKLSGAALDKAYMDAMVKDHVEAAAGFERAAQQVQDADLKAWAAKNVPVLHDHHHSAEAIVKKLR